MYNLILWYMFCTGHSVTQWKLRVAPWLERIYHLLNTATDTPSTYRMVHQKIYRYLFWVGYLSVLITTLLPVTGELNKIHIGPEAFYIRLDIYFTFSFIFWSVCISFSDNGKGLPCSIKIPYKNLLRWFYFWQQVLK